MTSVFRSSLPAFDVTVTPGQMASDSSVTTDHRTGHRIHGLCERGDAERRAMFRRTHSDAPFDLLNPGGLFGRRVPIQSAPHPVEQTAPTIEMAGAVTGRFPVIVSAISIASASRQYRHFVDRA